VDLQELKQIRFVAVNMKTTLLWVVTTHILIAAFGRNLLPPFYPEDGDSKFF
jgi:hypothetical protein